MKIETKLDVGDYGWFMAFNVPQESRITKISIEVIRNCYYNDELDIMYSINSLLKTENKRGILREDKIFKTKQDLLDSL